MISTLWHAPGRIWAAMMAAAAPRFWAQVGAGMAMTVVLVGYGLVIWLGPWPVTLACKQLDLLGQGQLMAGFLVLVALVCITGMKVGFSGGREGFHADLDQPDEPPSPPPAKITTTTTTEVTKP
jgi:hypothetical protein